MALLCRIASQTTTNTSVQTLPYKHFHTTPQLSTTTTPQWHPNSRRLPRWLQVPPPRHLLRRQRTRRSFRRRLLMAKRGSTEQIARRLILLTPTKVRVNFPLIPSSVYSFDRLTVLKRLHLDIGILNMAMDILDLFINDIFERIATEASSRLFHPLTTLTSNILLELASYSKKSTISSREIQTSVRLILPGELATYAISHGTKSAKDCMCTNLPTSSYSYTNSFVQSCHLKIRLSLLYFSPRLSNFFSLFFSENLMFVLYITCITTCDRMHI